MPDLAEARVLVAGAAGFIGANLVRRLLQGGSQVTSLVRPGGSSWRLEEIERDLDLVEVDVRDAAAVAELVADHRPELAVNLASTGGHPKTQEARQAQLETSVLGSAAIVEALAGTGCTRLVHVGSSLEYGPSMEPMREDDPLAPTVPRGAAKAAGTLVCLVWARALELPTVALRPFSVYGPWESGSRLVPSALRAAIDGSELPLTEAGLVRDFVYVDDVVEAILRALTAPASLDGRIVNVGSGVQTTNEELVEIAGRVVGRTDPHRERRPRMHSPTTRARGLPTSRSPGNCSTARPRLRSRRGCAALSHGSRARCRPSTRDARRRRKRRRPRVSQHGDAAGAPWPHRSRARRTTA